MTNAPEGERTTGCTESGLTSVMGHGFAAGLEPDTRENCGKTKWTSRNVLPREQSEPCLFSSGYGKASEHAAISSFPVPAVGGKSESALISCGPLRNTSNTPDSSGESHGTETREPVISSFSAEVAVPLTCLLKNATNTHRSSGELHGTITATHTAQRMFSALPVPFVPSGFDLVSRNTYINRKKRNRETCWRQSKALKRVLREAKRKLVAQPEISHEAAEAILRSQAPRTDEKFPGIIHVSHWLAYTATRTCFSEHNAVLSTLVDH